MLVQSGNLVDVARQWVEKQGLLPSSEELPLTESFPSNGGLIAVSVSTKKLSVLQICFVPLSMLEIIYYPRVN